MIVAFLILVCASPFSSSLFIFHVRQLCSFDCCPLSVGKMHLLRLVALYHHFRCLLLALLIADLLCSLQAFNFGRRRRRNGQFDSAEWDYFDTGRSCAAMCDAEFARNFEDEFGRSYITQFFDFPIDPLLSSTRSAFPTFCRLVQSRHCCLRSECLQEQIPPSPQSHICIEHRPQFERALNCLNVTNGHFHFHAACSKAAKRSINVDRELAETRGFSEPQAEYYHQQDLRCRFQACILQSRMELIEAHCSPEERGQTRETVLRYYIEDLELDLGENEEQLNATRHFPRFCTAFLASQKRDSSAMLALGEEYSNIYEETLHFLRMAKE